MVGLFSCWTSTSVTIPRASALGGANARSHARQAFNSRVRFCSKRCADKPHAPRAWDWQTRRVSPHEPMWTLPPELPNKHRQSQRFDNSDRSVVTSTRRNSGMRSRVGSPALQATSWGFFSSTIRATSKQRTRPEHLRSGCSSSSEARLRHEWILPVLPIMLVKIRPNLLASAATSELTVLVDFPFGLQPVFKFVATLSASRLIKFISARRDLILIGMVFAR
jgi:hypothetical protein